MKRSLILFSLIIFSFFCRAQSDKVLSIYNGETEITASNSITLKSGFSVSAGQSLWLHIQPGFSNCVDFVSAASADQNFIQITSFKIPGITNPEVALKTCEKTQTIQYFDGLGRSVQTVEVMGSPNNKDIIAPVVYNEFGKNPINYLAYVDRFTNGNGRYRNSAITEQNSFYTNPPTGLSSNANPYSVTVYNGSPLNRITEQGASGAAWQPQTNPELSHTIRKEYGLNNDVIVVSDAKFRGVRRYQATSPNNDQNRTLVDAGWYPKNELLLDITKDENWQTSDGRAGTTETYTDKFGKLILQRTWLNATVPLSTYYVYDKFGNGCFVIPPKAEGDQTTAISQNTLNNLCFQYRFDTYNRLVEKKLPGRGWEYMIYNKLDQLIMIQNANQRNKSPQQWSFMKYDALGREIISGIFKDAGSTADASGVNPSNVRRIALQSTSTAQTTLWEKRNNPGVMGYTNLSMPNAGIDAYLLVNYFDNYSFPELPATYDKRNDYSKRTEGLLTATRVGILEDPSKMLWTINYYNDKGEIVRAYIQNFKSGVVNDANCDEISNTYSFIGQLTASTQIHKTSGTNLEIKNKYIYDDQGRKKAVYQQINNEQEVLISLLEYNELGLPINKKLHSIDNGATALQNLSYSYNERGWLKGISSGLFNMELRYNNPVQGTAQYNGNISSFRWGQSLEKTFNYSYDKLNRLTAGASQDISENGITYDKVGNIKTLVRNGQSISYNHTSGGVEGNQLISVSGAGLNTASYVYDLNGNATTDGSKTNLKLIYNLFDLPQTISGSQSVTYTYSALGGMLRKQSATIGQIEYVNGIQYADNEIDFIPNDEGRAIRQSNGAYVYQYDLKDNLGNVRVTFDKNSTNNTARKIQEDEYYPFGLRKPISSLSSNNKYLYNGKELQDELNQYDYGARFYDPVVARWSVGDPHAENYFNASPYSYVVNNPINLIDPSGMDPLGWIEPSGGGMFYWDPLINSPEDFRIRGKSGERYMGQDGYGIDPKSGMGIYFNDDGTFRPHIPYLEEVVVRGSRISPSMGMRALDVGTDFLPVVGSSKDVYRGIRDGNLFQFGLGVGGLILDVASLGTGSLLKGGIKVGVKGLAEAGVREAAEQAAKTGSRVFEVGSYSTLRGVETGLDAHHVGQKALMSKFVPDYNLSTAPAILVPKLGHTEGAGVLLRGTSGFSNARQVLARDIFELRRVYSNVPNSSLEQLIQMNKTMYPSAFLK